MCRLIGYYPFQASKNRPAQTKQLRTEKASFGRLDRGKDVGYSHAEEENHLTEQVRIPSLKNWLP